MAISSQGIGSGLDVNSIVTQLVAIEKQPLQTLQTKATALQTQLSLYGTIKSQVSALQDAATVLASSSAWTAQSATSSNTAVATVGADATASSTEFGLDVSRLAKAQTIASRSVAIGATLGAVGGPGTGVLTIQLGSWDPLGADSFANGSSLPMTVNVKETDTYADIATAINAQNAGVKATVLKSGGLERLSFQSITTGNAAGFKISSTGDFAELSSLSFTTIANASQSGSGMESSQAGLNAAFKINGVAIESATNSVANVVAGVTINLLQTTSSGAPVQISVVQDKAAVQKNIQSFADAYTALSKTLADSTKYVSGGKSGVLQGDSITVGIQSLMRKIAGSASVGSTFSRLTQVGLQQQVDGSMKLVVDIQGTGRTDNLKSAMSDMANLKVLFTADNSNSATNGFALKLRDFSKGLLAVDGTVSNKSAALQGAITRNGDEQDKVTQRASNVEKQLRKQYSALDAQMAQMSSLSSYVTAQLAQWNKTG